METVGIIVDDWKLIIFTKYLRKAGYEYEKHDGPTKDSTTLKVKTENLYELQEVVRMANDEAAKSKMN